MLTSFSAAENTIAAGNPILNIAVFVASIAAAMSIATRVGRGGNKEASDFYTGGIQFSDIQDSLAIAGDYPSAASFLGTVGAIALTGYNGFLYSIGFFVTWSVVPPLIAGPLRNVGKFTMADVLSFRLKQCPVRTAAAISTLAVTLSCLIAQMTGADSPVVVLLNIHDSTQQSIAVAVVGIIIVAYVPIGGTKGTIYVQMIKAVLLVGAAIIMILTILMGVKGSFSQSLQDVVDMHTNSDHIAEKSYEASAILESGLEYGGSFVQQLNFVSLGLAPVLGAAGLLHVLMRFYTIPTAKEARKSVTWVIILIGGFCLLTLVPGYGTIALVDLDRISAAPDGVNATAPLPAFELGDSISMAVASAMAFATALAVIANLAITASASVDQDLYQTVICKGQVVETKQVRVSCITAIMLGVVAIILGILAMGQNAVFLVSLAFAAATSTNVLTILMSLFWGRFNTTGTAASMYTGVIVSLALTIFSPTAFGNESLMIPSVDFSWFPLTSSGLPAIPLAFLAGIIATYMDKPDNFDDLATEMKVRSLTGVGTEVAVNH